MASGPPRVDETALISCQRSAGSDAAGHATCRELPHHSRPQAFVLRVHTPPGSRDLADPHSVGILRATAWPARAGALDLPAVRAGRRGRGRRTARARGWAGLAASGVSGRRARLALLVV